MLISFLAYSSILKMEVIFLWNVKWFWSDCRVLYPRKYNSSILTLATSAVIICASVIMLCLHRL
jgi:hypothetical protein